MDFSTPQEKEAYVKTLFGNIAGCYDFLNTLMSFNLDRKWRRKAALKTGILPGDHILDCCCGTGALSRELVSLTGEKGTVVGIDFCPEMLLRARENCPTAHFVHGNVMDLPFDHGSFDASIMGFGLRNVADQAKAIQEMVRVVAAGGRVVILELNRPSIPLFKQAFSFYFNRLVPFIGSLASGWEYAYLYLSRSYSMLPQPGEIMDMMTHAGLVGVNMEEMGGGVVAVFWGTVRGTGGQVQCPTM